MALSKGMVLFCLTTLLVCSLIRLAQADCSDAGHADDHQRCWEDNVEVEDDDDDVDDTYKIVNEVSIKAPVSSYGPILDRRLTETQPEDETTDTEMIVMGH